MINEVFTCPNECRVSVVKLAKEVDLTQNDLSLFP